jgi:hypothetical protein
MLNPIKTITGYKFICDLTGKQIEKSDVHTIDGKRVYSKEGMELIPSFLHHPDRLKKLSQLRYLRSVYKEDNGNPFQGIVVLREIAGGISIHSTPNNLGGALDELNAVEVSFKTNYDYGKAATYDNLFHIFQDKEHLLTRHGSNSIHLGWEEYGHWTEIGSWMDIHYNICQRARTRYGIAQMTKTCAGTPLGKIYMQQSQLFDKGKCFQNRYVFLDQCVENPGFKAATFPKDAKLIQVFND